MLDCMLRKKRAQNLGKSGSQSQSQSQRQAALKGSVTRESPKRGGRKGKERFGLKWKEEGGRNIQERRSYMKGELTKSRQPTLSCRLNVLLTKERSCLHENHRGFLCLENHLQVRLVWTKSRTVLRSRSMPIRPMLRTSVRWHN